MPNVVFRPRVSERTPSRTWFAELATAPGPQVIGVTGDNSDQALFGREWALEWSVEDDTLRLYQESAAHPGEWERVTADLPLVFDSPLPASARRVTFCFDQSARIVVAVEDEGVIKVTRWDPGTNQYVQNVSFAGVDPALAMDATWARYIPGSDVLLFYLSSDRRTVMCRVQRETYAVEHELQVYDAPVILDRVHGLAWRYQLLLADAAGEPLDHALISSQYPIRTLVTLDGDGAIVAGMYEQVAEAYVHGVHVQGDGLVASGEYLTPLTAYEHTVALDGDGVVHSGLYEAAIEVVLVQHTVAVEGDGVIEVGSYDEIGIQVMHTVVVDGDGQIIGGSYATP